MRPHLSSTLPVLLAAAALAGPGALRAEPSDIAAAELISDSAISVSSPFSDLQPTDWAYEALSTLLKRYDCVAGYPNDTFLGGRPLTRFEAAALLNACLERVSENTDELKRLTREFAREIAVLRGRTDGLEARVGELEASQFSTTTRLTGVATFVVGANAFSGSNAPLVQQAREIEGGASFNYDVRLSLDTSFTGKDLLRTELRSGNFLDSAWGNGDGLNQLEVAFEESCAFGVDCGNVVSLYRIFYQFPLGSDFTVTFGGRVRQDDMLAMWPSVYPSDTMLDYFTFAGSAGAYNTNLGTGAGLWWKKNGWSISGQYIAYNGDFRLGSDQSGETGTLQLGYVGEPGNWGAAAVYTYTNGFPGGVYPGSATPLAALNAAAYPPLAGFGIGDTNSIGLSAYWQPVSSGWMPSISLGWGLNRIQPGEGVGGFDPLTTQSWYVGLQWLDAFRKGNNAGMAFGQPTFLTACGNSCAQLLGPDQTAPSDGLFAWEWWYSIRVSDQITVTPALFYLSNPYGQINKLLADQAGISNGSFNNLGVLIKTTFQF